ncbi:hypothetical protein L208DRAFT_1390839, partial [Tricholoma matsutake]
MRGRPGRTRCKFRLRPVRPQILIFNFLPAAACQIGHYNGRKHSLKHQLALMTHVLLSCLVASPPFL